MEVQGSASCRRTPALRRGAGHVLVQYSKDIQRPVAARSITATEVRVGPPFPEISLTRCAQSECVVLDAGLDDADKRSTIVNLVYEVEQEVKNQTYKLVCPSCKQPKICALRQALGGSAPFMCVLQGTKASTSEKKVIQSLLALGIVCDRCLGGARSQDPEWAVFELGRAGVCRLPGDCVRVVES